MGSPSSRFLRIPGGNQDGALSFCREIIRKVLKRYALKINIIWVTGPSVDNGAVNDNFNTFRNQLIATA